MNTKNRGDFRHVQKWEQTSQITQLQCLGAMSAVLRSTLYIYTRSVDQEVQVGGVHEVDDLDEDEEEREPLCDHDVGDEEEEGGLERRVEQDPPVLFC